MKGNTKMPNVARAAGAVVGPGAKEHREMIRKHGFTLVELLVVIAIISILAAIVTPKVQGYILRARMTRAVAELESVNTALSKVLTDAGKDNLRQLFLADDDNDPATHYAQMDSPVDAAELKSQIAAHTSAFYEILRQGRKADLTASGLQFAAGVREKLGSSYLDLGRDPWDRLYQFWMGPWKGTQSDPNAYIQFRSYRSAIENDDGTYTVYKYDADHKADLDAVIPGNPAAEDAANALPGFPAPKDLGAYVFSTGVNMRADQFFNDDKVTEDNYKGGGDDINNWDNEQGWTEFYS